MSKNPKNFSAVQRRQTNQPNGQSVEINLAAPVISTLPTVAPLAEVTVTGLPEETHRIEAWDGEGTVYYRVDAAPTVAFRVSGALGPHHLLAFAADLHRHGFRSPGRQHVHAPRANPFWHFPR